eukprot:c12488_g1_i2.p1 GENE.c12488_g1_i2~~c12488_g1_i2.p1  ORF type:complete len:252 (+),score=12.52 c12488_g1_i2:3-758(+)
MGVCIGMAQEGVLLGLAAGDRNGGPIQMALCLAESLSNCRSYDPCDVFSAYLKWWRRGSGVDAWDTGPTCASLFAAQTGPLRVDALVRRSQEYHKRTQSAGCNSAHRCAPLSLAPFLSMEQLVVCSRLESSLTHADPRSLETCVAVNVICRCLTQAESIEQSIRTAESLVTNDEVKSILSLASSWAVNPSLLASERYRLDTARSTTSCACLHCVCWADQLLSCLSGCDQRRPVRSWCYSRKFVGSLSPGCE